jgi:hypothetical protein
VYVTVGSRPTRSKVDAEYFLAWIDRLRAAAEASRDWNTADERRAVLDTLAKARAEFERRAQE